MIATGDWLTPTRLTGAFAYGGGLLCCGAVWARSGARPGRRGLAAALTGIEAVLLLDILFNWRWAIHRRVMDYAIGHGIYGDRHGPQIAALFLLAGLLLAGWAFLRKRCRRRPGAALALGGALLSVIGWLAETVSLHSVDAVLHHKAGPFMAVGYLWLAAASATSAGAVWDARRAESAPAAVSFERKARLR